MKKMLVVEDDDLSQKMLKKIFSKDFDIDCCNSSEEFYDKYNNVRYEIIIMDISLKGSKHGLDLIKEIRFLPLYAKTPIICLTAHARAKTRMEAIESGSDLFIAKPVSNQDLKDAVSSLLNMKLR
ncbi:MAG: response regulator [Bacteroidota bacterium]